MLGGLVYGSPYGVFRFMFINEEVISSLRVNINQEMKNTSVEVKKVRKASTEIFVSPLLTVNVLNCVRIFFFYLTKNTCQSILFECYYHCL